MSISFFNWNNYGRAAFPRTSGRSPSRIIHYALLNYKSARVNAFKCLSPTWISDLCYSPHTFFLLTTLISGKYNNYLDQIFSWKKFLKGCDGAISLRFLILHWVFCCAKNSILIKLLFLIFCFALCFIEFN